MIRLLVAIVGVLVLPRVVRDVLAWQAANSLRALQSDEPEPEDAWLVASGALRELMAQVGA